ncbi:putative isomerase YbhE [Leucogyrophana mollusca]|uniref:Isomerase YbhE n=1 Tax=Leucogyrophana mollusca TaxID=85980 RepID=A0ACB8BM47_9AGAM|nr:putative isomerase YbhE [Leucogyrophana mollusca]
MVNFNILAGGYTGYIASYLFNTDTNSLTYQNQYLTGGNPSWIISHPTDKSILYATNENTPGGLQSFEVGPSGSLSAAIDTVYSGGDGPPYCGGLPGGQVAVVNYNSGTARVVPTTYDPLHFDINASTIITFPVPTTGDQGMSEPHMAYPYGDELLIPDKGNDKIWRLGQTDSPGDFAVHGFIQAPIGSGPRHIQIYEGMLYVVHELASTLTLQEFPMAPNGTTPILSNVSILPPTYPAGSEFAGAEVLIPEPTPEYPIPYIYASNRNTGVLDPRGDTIAIFQNVNNELKLVQQVYTGLDQVRGMMFGQQAGSGGEAYLAAAGVNGTAGVKIFKRTEGGANLQEVAVNLELPTRTSFVWLPA